MRKSVRLLTMLSLALAALLASTPVASAAAWSSSDRWGAWNNGGYTVRNNIWGSGHGPQSIWANSYSNWGVWADHPNTGGVKSYPHASKLVNRRLSQVGSLRSSFNVNVPSAGSYATAYDIWCDGHAYEIMLWVNWAGAVGPIGTHQATTTVGGHTWDVYRGSNGSNAVFSFLRRGHTSAGTVDIKAVLDWIRNRNWFGDVTVSDVQFGYEITSSRGGLNFTTNSYSVTG
ncbi:hypothetical protein JOF53_008464 [Crossiella equi]|uniref:Glycosyl hydrolase family 12 n=1 Tax=Crossiella equi TaxID=130796 RepID=A0ABS5AT48_9PSEU|nr:hypothetical protein [Crossiella equi]MBP2479592.1 hypothetical protein [Crossiella equi]